MRRYWVPKGKQLTESKERIIAVGRGGERGEVDSGAREEHGHHCLLLLRRNNRV